ncbi:hypothetical protein K438DRAFT_1766599 [Mycena galopus ATCC 62051]|nr:hypothetical protein K438DRAFT_1766599 [Mycena galopus ATCC 62051]
MKQLRANIIYKRPRTAPAGPPAAAAGDTTVGESAAPPPKPTPSASINTHAVNDRHKIARGLLDIPDMRLAAAGVRARTSVVASPPLQVVGERTVVLGKAKTSERRRRIAYGIRRQMPAVIHESFEQSDSGDSVVVNHEGLERRELGGVENVGVVSNVHVVEREEVINKTVGLAENRGRHDGVRG